MLNFTVGPVQTPKEVRELGSNQVPYFRTPEFSIVMKENEKLIKEFANAPENSRAVFITGSGTASMEASVINLLTEKDNALIINGGSFGQRFVDICNIHSIPHEEIKLSAGEELTREKLYSFNGKYTALLVNLHETSTGVLYDIDLLSEYCKENGLLFIVDAISCFLAEEIDMAKSGVDLLITGSQKALACPPGISVIVMNERTVKRVYETPTKCMYLDLKSALDNGERGQTPFTPAVGILLQINKRLKLIEENGGVKTEVERVKKLANYFRSKISDMPFKPFTTSPSNAVTALKTDDDSAYAIFTKLKDEYGIWVCPNGGALKDSVFRVGHIGDLTTDDYDKLVFALKEIIKGVE
ncbi:MAG: alanine--glyoxylate aminotransferase family protein [Clostridia bacterium]|nr:alanine--glyoxylate aminotransferase family protein [Clostridia bacterium]